MAGNSGNPLDDLIASTLDRSDQSDVPDTSPLPVSSRSVPQAPVQPEREAQPIPTGPRPILMDLLGAAGAIPTPRMQPAVGAMGAVGPQDPRQSRASTFESFLSNFVYALGQGFENAGHGPGSFGRGFGA